jgi:putative toxin-antitoxin system antitoxin component (TIGR02293 family)
MKSAVLGEEALTKKVLVVISGKAALKEKEGSVPARDFVAKGFPFQAGNNVKTLLGLSDREIAETIGTSEKTLQRMRKKKAPFSMVESDRLYRMARIFALASHVMGGDDIAKEWLHKPQYGLGEELPIEVIKTEEGAREVEELLYRIEYGVLA